MKRPPGRPALAVEQRKSRNLSFRVRPHLRQQMAERAAANNRSVSEQVEYELTRALDREQIATEFLEWMEKALDAALQAIRKERSR